MKSRDLSLGDSGKDVKLVQHRLKTLGYFNGAVDGNYGQDTADAVKRFQEANGIKADGVARLQTRATLAGKIKARKKKLLKKSKKKKRKGDVSHEMGRWNGHKFVISPKLIYSFSNLQVKGSSEMKEKKETEQGTVARKGGNPIEVTLTIPLNRFTGCFVRKEAMSFVSEAREGKTDYFYVGNKKLVECKLMLTDATVKDVTITSEGKWKSAEVQLTMKQCDKGDGFMGSNSSDSSNNSGSNSDGSGSDGNGGGGGNNSGDNGSNKISVTDSTPTTDTTTTWVQNTQQAQDIANDVGNKIKGFFNNMWNNSSSSSQQVPSANQTINRITNAANTTTRNNNGGGRTWVQMYR